MISSEMMDEDLDAEVSHHHQRALSPQCEAWRRWLRRVLRSRVCLEVRIKEFAFHNPKRFHFCRERFVTASDVEIALSASVEDCLRLCSLFRVWSWRPRDQPTRRTGDGGGLAYGVVSPSGFAKQWRNRRMLGVLDVDRFDVCDAEVAFERAEGKLNVCAIGQALADGEIRHAAARATTTAKETSPLLLVRRHQRARAAKFVAKKKPTRLRVDVLAARHLDAASWGAAHPRESSRPTSSGRRFKTDRFAAPSCFARILVRGQERRSRTILRSANPSYRYEPSEPFFVDDPSAVVHVGIFEEGAFGDHLIAQFATTLKQLVLDPDAVDGGAAALEVRDDAETLDRRGFVPLRDAKWRVFTNVEIAEPDRQVDKPEEFEFVNDTTLETTRGSLLSDVPSSAACCSYDESSTRPSSTMTTSSTSTTTSSTTTTTSSTSSSCCGGPEKQSATIGEVARSRPAPGYPAVLLRVRWDVPETPLAEPAMGAMEQLKINSFETAARCGNVDAVRAMLATFPYYFDVRGGFRLRGEASLAISDLFLGKEGHLERRRARHGGRLLPKDWRAAKRNAISITNIEVPFPVYDPAAATMPTMKPHSCPMEAALSAVTAGFFVGASSSKATTAENDDESTSSVPSETASELSPPPSCLGGAMARAMKGSVAEQPGLLTLEAATLTLIRGLVARLVSVGRVSSSIGQIAAAVGYSSLHAPRGGHPVEEDDSTRQSQAERAVRRARAANPTSVVGRTRFHRQVSLTLGLARSSFYKKFDARGIDDMDRDVACSGLLLKRTASARWRPCRCVLRGATLFYHKVSDARDHAPVGEDYVVDLRRVVCDLDAHRKWDDDVGDLLRVTLHDDVFELSVRQSSGDVGVVALKPYTSRQASSEEEEQPTIAAWRDAVVAAVLTARKAARKEVLNVVGQYASSQLDVVRRGLEQRLSPEHAVHALDLPKDDEQRGLLRRVESASSNASSNVNDDDDDTRRLSSRGKQQPRQRRRSYGVTTSTTKKAGRTAAINGAYALTRRGGQQDALFVAESTSFSARTVASANGGQLFVDVLDERRAVLYFDDGAFLPHRFVGPLDVPTKTRFLADRPDSTLVCMDTLSLSPDGTALVLSIASPETGAVFFRAEWRLCGRKLEQRSRWVTTSNVATSSLLIKRDFDLYERMPPDQAARLELAVA